MLELERTVKCGRCEENFIQKWVVAQKQGSQINSVSCGANGKKGNDYELLCRGCLKKGFEENRKDFLSLVDIRKRKMFINYRGSGVFDKVDHVNHIVNR